MKVDICEACGSVNPPHYHFGRQCEARRDIERMKGFGYVPIPGRCLTRAFRAAGVPVFHGPTTLDQTGNWVPKWFWDVFVASCGGRILRGHALRRHVEAVVEWVVRGRQGSFPLAS
jgi:hypothetical protein